MKPIPVVCELSLGEREGRVYRGEIAPHESSRFLADAVIDISSVHTLIPHAWVTKLGARTHEADYPWFFGPDPVLKAEAIRIGLNGHETMEFPIVRGDQIVLGLTAWTKLDFKLDEQGKIVPRHAEGQLLRI